jgi:endoglucanase
MGNHLEAPNEGDFGRPINDTDFAAIAAEGFETVRLPVRWSNHADTNAPYAIDPDFMARVIEVVDQARAAGLRVVLDLHHYSDPQGDIYENPELEAPRLAGIWRQVGDQFSSYPDDVLWFELLNEPSVNLTNRNLLSILNPALAEIRVSNPTRPVVVGGEGFSSIRSLATLPIPNDPYIIATFHYYDPFFFTHQGAPFITPVPPTGVRFTQADRDQLARDVQIARDFMARTGRPLWLGEYGVFEDVALDERAEYYEAVNTAYGDADIDGCPWAYTNTFQFREGNGGWIQQLLTAIGL